MKYSRSQLAQKQYLNLYQKMDISIAVVKEFIIKCEETGNEPVISVAGIDSWVLNDLLQRNGINLKRASVPILEPKGNNMVNSKLENIVFVKPKWGKKEVIRSYGYPIVYKNLSMALNRYMRAYRRGDEKIMDSRINGSEKGMEGTIPKKWQFLIYAPFFATETCCDKLKKAPLKILSKYAITGEMASETPSRQAEWLDHGCVIFTDKKAKCTPLSIWTSQDILAYLKCFNIKNYSPEYGEIIETGNIYERIDGTHKEYRFTGEQRTGCDICTFGIMNDLDRFNRMKDSKPLVYQTMMNGGEFIETDFLRPVIYEPNGKVEMTNKVWVPNKKGFGYGYVIDYINMFQSKNIKR